MRRWIGWMVVAAAMGLAACASTPRPEREAVCDGPQRWADAARMEAVGLYGLDIDLFGRPEHGWAIYAAAAARELAVPCPAASPVFAAALAAWQAAHGLASSGVMDAATLGTMKAIWQGRRPFVTLRGRGICPPPPAPVALASVSPADTAGKPVQLRRRALKAYRRMVAAARREEPAVAADPEQLRVFSGSRSPEDDAARCSSQGNCDGVVRAQCSAHRTGLAMDLMVGAAPGFAVDSSADANRLFQSRTAAYRWLVANAGRFGFVNYPFEPWHWEWTGEPIVSAPFQN